MKTYFSILLFLYIGQSIQSHAQELETVFRIHKIVGDTIDRSEKLKFRVLPTVRNENFKYAVCLIEGDEMYLMVRQFNGTELKVPYNSDMWLEDIDRILLNQNNREVDEAAVSAKPLSGKPVIMITSGRSNRTKVLKKGRVIEINLKGTNNIRKIRINRVIAAPQPAVVVTNDISNTEIIKLSEINYIYKYRHAEHELWRGLGAVYVVIGAIAVISNPSESALMGTTFMTGGIIPWFFKNEKIKIDLAKIEVKYR